MSGLYYGYGQTETIDLKTIEDGRAPKSRLSDPNKAYDIVDTLIRANAKRADINSRVKGQLDGNPPFDPSVLRKNSQSNRTNINFREAEAIHNAAVSPFYDLFAESPWYCEVQCDYGREADRINWSQIVTQEFDRMLKEWDKFDYTMQLIISNRTDFGPGFAMWPDNENWQPDVVQHSQVLVPDDTNCTVDDDVDIIVVREKYPLVKLWEFIRDARSATAAGWNREQVLHEMYAATPEYQTRSQMNDSDFYEWYQQRIRDNDISESVRSSKVAAAHLLVREFDGSITHSIIGERAVPQLEPPSSNGQPKRHNFLFHRVSQFESYRQVLAAFFYDIGDGKWHSVKGLLVKMYPFVALKDRLNCATMDNAFLNMSLLVKAQNKAALQDLQLLRVGAMTILPPDLELQQHQLIGRMEESLVVERHLDNKLSTNIGQYRQTAQKEQGNPETATKVMADQSKEAMLNKSAVNRWYRELDFYYTEIYRRASNRKLRAGSKPNDAARAFQKRCISRGVPEEALSKVRCVRAYRNVGNGSIFMRQAAFQNGMAIVPMMNEEGRNNWLNDSIAALYSQDMVSRYNPQPKDQHGVQEEMSYAMLENSALHDGLIPMVAATQNHVVHADTHLKFGAEAAQSLQRGGNPMDVYNTLQATGKHVLQHLGQFQNDPTRQKQFQALETTWKDLAKFTDQLERQIMQMQKQQAQNAQRGPQMMNEQQMKQAQMQADIQRKNFKATVDVETKQKKADQALEINARKAEQQEAIADVTTAADLKRQQVKTEADLARKEEQAKAQAKAKPKPKPKK